MKLLAVFPLIFAGISLYVSLYHLFIFFKRQKKYVHLSFAITCFIACVYNIFCSQLYNVNSPYEGLIWQRFMRMFVSLLCISFMWFFAHYVNLKNTKIVKIFTACCSMMFLAFAVVRSDLAFSNTISSIKVVSLPFNIVLQYFEMKGGPLTDISNFIIIVGMLYIFFMSLKIYKRKRIQNVKAFIVGISIFFIGATNDILIGAGVYGFFYLTEFLYIFVLIIMAYTLSNDYIRFAETKHELSDSYEQFKHLAEAPFEGIVIHDHGRIILANQQFYKMFSYKKNDLCHRVIDLIFTEPYKKCISRRKGHKNNISFEAQGITKDNEILPLRILLKNISYKGKKVQVAAIRDLSEVKKAENEKQRLQNQLYLQSKLASIGELTAGIAHEINNPLTIIKGYLDVLSENNKSLDLKAQKTFLKKITTAADRMTNIVQGLKINLRTENQENAVFDVNYIIKNTLQLIESIYSREKINLKVNMYRKNLTIKGNAGQFQQALLNILSNSKDASIGIKNAEIQISTELIENNVTLKIKDNGVGIKKENLEKIYDSFFTTKEPGRGLGLGLGITYNIIQNLNGTIHITSEEGQGTEVSITVPLFTRKLIEKKDTDKKILIALKNKNLKDKNLNIH